MQKKGINQSISHGGVWNVVQALGQKVKKEETEQAKLAEKNQLCGEREVPVLFEEADGVYINIQGKDRPKSGKKLEMKVAVAYEGWKRTGKDRYELVNKLACAGFEDISEFYRIKEAMISREYNVDEIQIEKEQMKLKVLYKYFKENLEGLIPYQERGLDIPKPPAGIEYHSLGTMEHHICDIIAKRMKQGQRPFTNYPVTNGRKAIRSMFDMRNFSDLVYR